MKKKPKNVHRNIGCQLPDSEEKPRYRQGSPSGGDARVVGGTQ